MANVTCAYNAVKITSDDHKSIVSRNCNKRNEFHALRFYEGTFEYEINMQAEEPDVSEDLHIFDGLFNHQKLDNKFMFILKCEKPDEHYGVRKLIKKIISRVEAITVGFRN